MNNMLQVLFRMLMMLIEQKKYVTHSDGNNFRLFSGYYITKNGDEITIVNENHDRESDSDDAVVVFSLKSPFLPNVYSFVENMMNIELGPAFSQYYTSIEEVTVTSAWTDLQDTEEDLQDTEEDLQDTEEDLPLTTTNETGRKWKTKKKAA